MKSYKDYLNETTIDLGTANGWSKETSEMYSGLAELKIPGTERGRNLGRCYNSYSFDVLIDDNTYTVTYKVDSGD